MKLVISLFTLFITISYSSSAELKKFDLNKDKKFDRFEHYENSKLIKLEEDRNYDGKIDYRKTYNSKNFSEIEEQDSDFDGKFDRIKKVELPKDGKSKILYSVDKDFDGKFEINYTSSITHDQKRDSHSCASLNLDLETINKISKSNFLITANLTEGYLTTDFGYLVDKECVKKWGLKFLDYLKESITEGQQCLDRLAAIKTKTMSAAQRNAHDLRELIKKNEVKLVCSEKDYDWKNTAGHASTSSKSKKILKPKAEHPYISISPNLMTEEDLKDEEQVNYLKRTLFHEQMHNLGYKHTDDMEMTYTCEECCMSGNYGSTPACKLCLGNFKNSMDPNYMENFILYASENSYYVDPTRPLQNFMKEYPKSTLPMVLYAKTNGNMFNSLGPAMAEIIKEEEIKLTPQQNQYLIESSEYANIHDTSKESSKAIAKIIFENYYNKDSMAALDYLDKNKEKILAELKALKESKVNDLYQQDNRVRIIKELDRVIFDIWINKYPGVEGADDKAYDLYVYFEDIIKAEKK